MSTPQNQRRRGRARAAGSGGRAETPGDQDALAGLRQAVADLDPAAFAAGFTPGGWLRVPRPEGDVVLRGPAEIERAGRELRDLLTDLTWTPSQRFVADGQVVEEAVAYARLAPPSGGDGRGEAEGIRVPMRVVAAVAERTGPAGHDGHDGLLGPGGRADPAGRGAGTSRIGSLTLWVDWAALRDPLGVQSARGAASALVAQARARDVRGLQVIRSEPGAAPLPPVPREPDERGTRSARPPAPVLWWQRNRATLAGAVMAAAAAALIAWVGLGVLDTANDSRVGAAEIGSRSTPSPSSSPAKPTTAPSRTADAGEVPRVTRKKPTAKPTVQAGQQIGDLKADLLFRTGSTELTAAAINRIGDVAQQVRRADVSGTIQVNGYTDDVGTERYNTSLSERRARAVALVLAEQLAGLPVELTPQGFGEDDPATSNATAEGRAKNRRVTVILPAPGSPRP